MGDNPATTVPHPGAPVCFVLTDVVGSTRLWELDALATDAAVARHDQIVRDVVEAAGGRLVKHRGEGDSTFSTFHDPVAALEAAADVVRALAAEPWPGDLVLRVRTGVHLGSAIERDGDWYGPTVNRAARLRGLAEPDEVLVSTAVSEVVASRLPPGLALVDRGDAALRGIDRNEWVRRLVDERPEAPRTELGATRLVVPLPASLAPNPHEHPLLGRAALLNDLRSRWSEVEAGRQRGVVLAGEAGMGKSRLARELALHAHGRGGVVIHAVCDTASGATVAPVAATVTSLLAGISPSSARRLAGEGADALARLDAHVAERLGVPPVVGATVDLGSVLEAVVDLVVAVASEAPVLAVVDDLHLAGDPVADVLARLLDDPRRPAVLMIATLRPTDVPAGGPVSRLLDDLAGRDAVWRVRLGGVDADATRELVARTAGGSAVADRAATLLHSATSGNPLFLTELLHDLDAHGTLLLVEDPEDLVLPESVAEIAMERVGRLSPDAAKALRVAAVLGREIDPTLVCEVADIPRRELLEAEELWEQLGLVIHGGSRAAFTHDLLRQAVLEQVPPDRRRLLHRRAARAVDAAADPAAAARHWLAAAEPGDGLTVAVAAALAAAAAVDVADVHEARRWAEAGLQALDGEALDAPEVRGPLELSRAQAWLHTSVELALAAADAAVRNARAADDPNTLARAALVRCNGYTVVLSGEDPDGMRLHEEALAALEHREPGLRSRLLANLANHRARRDGLGVSATPIADEAVELARATDDPAVLSNALRIWVQVRQGAPDAVARLARADEMVAAAARTGDRWELVLALQRRAGTRLELGDRSGYETDVAEAERRSARLDTATARYESRFRRVLRALLDGRFDDARRHLGHLAELAVVVPTAMDAWATQTLLLEREVGSLASMVPIVEDAVARNPSLVGYQAGLALALVDDHRLDDARVVLDALRADDYRLAPRDSSWPSVLALLAEVAVRTGHHSAMPGLRAQLAPYAGLLLLGYESICLGAADRFLGMIDASTGAPAEDAFAAAAALEQRVDAPALLARTRLWHGRARYDAGDRDGAAVMLDAAAELAADLGMAGVAADSRTLLQQASSSAT